MFTSLPLCTVVFSGGVVIFTINDMYVIYINIFSYKQTYKYICIRGVLIFGFYQMNFLVLIVNRDLIFHYGYALLKFMLYVHTNTS